MSEWFISKAGKAHGPFSSSELKQLAVAAKINSETEVRLGSDGKWTTAKHVKGLFVSQPAVEATPATRAAVIAPATPPPLPVTRPATAVNPPSPIPPAATRDSSAGEKELLKVHPSFFRNDPIGFCALILFGIVGCIVIPAGFLVSRRLDEYHVVSLVGLTLTIVCGFLFLMAWLRYQRISLIVTDKRTTLRFGILSRYVKEVRHSDVRMLVVSQGFLQRILGVGKLAVASAATGESDIVAGGIPNPEKIKEMIDSFRP